MSAGAFPHSDPGSFCEGDRGSLGRFSPWLSTSPAATCAAVLLSSVRCHPLPAPPGQTVNRSQFMMVNLLQVFTASPQQYGLAQPQQGCGLFQCDLSLCTAATRILSVSAVNKAPSGSAVGLVTPLGYKKRLCVLKPSFKIRCFSVLYLTPCRMSKYVQLISRLSSKLLLAIPN